MSLTHSYTIVAHDEDDDSDICPVCDGECTCHKAVPTTMPQPQTFPKPPGVPLSMAELSLRYASTTVTSPISSSSGPYAHSQPASPPTSASVSAPTPPPPTPQQQQRQTQKPSLKIKLTVPPGLLAKQRVPPASSSSAGSSAVAQKHHYQQQQQHPATSQPQSHQKPPQHAGKSYKHLGATISDFGTVGYGNKPSSSSQPKKRGRPPKSSSSGHAQTVSQNLTTTTATSITTTHGFSAKKLPPNLKFKSKSKSHTSATNQKRSSSSSAPNRVRQTFKSRAPGVGGLVNKKSAAKKRRILQSSDEDFSSASDSVLSDIDMLDVHRGIVGGGVYLDDDDEASGLQFPTFVSASAISSSNSSDSSASSSSLSEFDSDSDIEAEEENFIVADVHDKARMKRELLGGDDHNNHHNNKKRTTNGDWVIRPRKKSVGPDDVEMDVDSDATEDDDDEDEEEDEDAADGDGVGGEADEDETEEDVTMNPAAGVVGVPPPSSSSQLGFDDDDETTTDDQRRRYVGVATGWSDDDDESSFDADLFFANLSGSSSSSGSSSDGDDDFSDDSDRSSTPFASAFHHQRSKSMPVGVGAGFGFGLGGSMGEEGDQSDISCMSECTERFGGAEFEVTEGWDGQIVFTNGIHDDRGLVDLEFEADAYRFDGGGLGSKASSVFGDDEGEQGGDRRHHGKESWRRKNRNRKMAGMGLGMDMGLGMGMDIAQGAEEGSDEDDEMSEGGYEEGDDGEGEGDTTDEELVGEDELPNERAMRLFSLPMSVSAINPLSTMSSPTVSPGRRRKEDEQSRERRRRRWGGESPCALDILQGKVTFWDSDEMEFDEEVDEYESAANGLGVFAGTLRGSSESASEVKRGPRKGVFVPSKETRQAVIGDDHKGAEVPSPHPRFNKGRKARYNTVESLLRRHLRSLTASISSTAGSEALLSPSGDAMGQSEQSSLEMLLTSAAAAAANGSSEDVKQEQQPEAEPIQLDDVLDAAFLDDPEPSSSAMDTTVVDGGANSADGVGRDASSSSGVVGQEQGEELQSVKNLSRWDVISVGAFRQVRENAWPEANRHSLHTPGSSVDLGSVIKSSPLSSMVWQNAAGAAAASSKDKSSLSVGGSGGRRGGGQASSSGASSGSLLPSVFKSGSAGSSSKSSSKVAKRRRIMMGGSTMSSPLILPLGSGSTSSAQTTPNGSSMNLVADKMHYQQQQQQQQQNQQQQNQKSRKELRRERKLMKKKTTSYGTPHVHGHHGHQFHAHHGHHPNSKMRSVSSSQRSNFFAASSVPPLNL